MKLEAEIIKDIPEKQIKIYQDKVVYYTAVETREYTKGMGAYPRLTGELERTEVASPITGGNATYNLLAGVRYAKYVWNYNNAKWTNAKTVPQWYKNIYKKYHNRILHTAKTRASQEIK